jgi:hypothetical protein
MEDRPYIYATDIVRVFPDYADSVIWFSDPMPYPETHLTVDLVTRLTDWETSYYSGLTDEFEWRSPDALHSFSAEGLELARAISEEIGSGFEVEYRSFENSDAVASLRSEHPAANPAAEAAFTARAERARADWSALRARLAAAPDAAPGWFARSSSGETFHSK